VSKSLESLGLGSTTSKHEIFINKLAERASAGSDQSYFRDLLEILPAAIYATDAAGRITYYNEAAARLWGHRPNIGDDRWCGSWKLYWPDGTPLPHHECPMAVALKTGQPVRGLDAVAERPDGVRVPFIPYPTPFYDQFGELAGAVNLLVDISELERAHQYEQQLAAIIASSDDAIIGKDLNGIIASWNRGAEQLFGYTAQEVIGKSITMLIPSDRKDEETRILERIRRGEKISHYEAVRQRKDGSLVDISLTVSPIKNAQGKIIGASKIARDITERKKLQNQQRVLVAEMKHRIKNTLSIVQAIAHDSLRSATGHDRESFGARLAALAGVHDLLTVENWDYAPLRTIVEKAISPFEENNRDRFSLTGPDVLLNPSKSLMLGLALHELATNAVKYGSLSNASGRVTIEWEISQPDRPNVKLRWIETGGPSVKQPKNKSFGSVLIEHSLEGGNGGAVFDYDPGGLICTFEIEP
jgi:two-component system CheB/CheR fusion protein